MRSQRTAGLQVSVVLVWMLCLLQLGVCGTANETPGLTLGSDELVARVQSRYDRTTHLHAHFKQETRVQGFDQPQTGAGQVWILKPGMMRWDYTTPERQTIIANGDTLWIYMPEDRQAIRDQVDQSLGTRTPALFLAGEARLTELFTLVEASIQGSSEGGLLQLKLTPKVGALPYTQVQLGIDPVSYLVRQVRLIDPMGNMTTMWFADLDTEGAVAPSLFQFQVPPGVDVIAPPVFPVPR
ncbi:MAG TPA: outer membrane lipoprotein chaperone LolA [Candidatus Tectomicrobia bacterium]